MPAGDLLSADWQIELRALLQGHGTYYTNDPDQFWGGFGMPDTKTADVELVGVDGSYATFDYAQARVLTFPFNISRSTMAGAMNTLSDLTNAWRPSNSADLELHGRIPGWGHWKVTGRPRGAVANLRRVKVGLIAVVCTFYCPNPAITLIA